MASPVPEVVREGREVKIIRHQSLSEQIAAEEEIGISADKQLLKAVDSEREATLKEVGEWLYKRSVLKPTGDGGGSYAPFLNQVDYKQLYSAVVQGRMPEEAR